MLYGYSRDSSQHIEYIRLERSAANLQISGLTTSCHLGHRTLQP